MQPSSNRQHCATRVTYHPLLSWQVTATDAAMDYRSDDPLRREHNSESSRLSPAEIGQTSGQRSGPKLQRSLSSLIKTIVGAVRGVLVLISLGKFAIRIRTYRLAIQSIIEIQRFSRSSLCQWPSATKGGRHRTYIFLVCKYLRKTYLVMNESPNRLDTLKRIASPAVGSDAIRVRRNMVVTKSKVLI